MRFVPGKLYVFIMMMLTLGATTAQTSGDTLAGAPPEIVLNTFVEKGKVALNETILFHVELSWIGNMSRYRITEIPQPILKNLMMKGSGSTNRLEELPGGGFRSHKIITYQFRPLEMGMAYIDGIEVRYIDMATRESDVLHSQRVSVEIVEPRSDRRGGVQAVIYIVLLAVFGAALVYFIFQFLRRRKQARQAPAPHQSLAETYLNRLGDEIDPKGTNLGEMIVLLSKLFREFLAHEFQLPAGETASADLLNRLKQNGLAEKEISRLDELFRKLDVIKFGGGEVDPAEFSLIYGTIEAFLLERKKLWDAENSHKKEA